MLSSKPTKYKREKKFGGGERSTEDVAGTESILLVVYKRQGPFSFEQNTALEVPNARAYTFYNPERQTKH
jgi:hypothetical protein